MAQFRLIIIFFLSLALAACSGGGSGKTVIGTSINYSSDGTTQTITTTYSDGTKSTANYAPISTSYSFSADGSQKTPVYLFSNGAINNGATVTGIFQSSSYSPDGSQKTVFYLFPGESRPHSMTMAGTAISTSWGADHVTKTTIFQFADNSTNQSIATVQPKLVDTTSTDAVYPNDWASGKSNGTVTKPVTTPRQDVFGDGFVKQVYEDGTALKPFTQANLISATPKVISDPNAFVAFGADAKPVNNNTPTNMIFDLRWGTPDPQGPAYAKNYFDQTTGKYEKSYKLPNSTFVFRAWLTSSGSCAFVTSADTNCGATLSPPAEDVIIAWKNGWTGKASNLLIWDDIGASPLSNHPVIVQTIAYHYAPGANFYGMSWSNADSRIPSNTVLNLDGTQTSTAAIIKMDAINMSFGANLLGYLGPQPIEGWTQSQLINARSHFSDFVSSGLLLTSPRYQGAFDFQSAVLIKSAGNDSIDAQYEPFNWYLAQNNNSLERLLIVGALDRSGTTGSQATLATYSNTAGVDPTIQSRFLVESGRVPYQDGDNRYGGIPLSGSSVGTSFAAPRVAGYVAIVRQKFPNLTAPNTADIMLATARYDTLTCYPNCDKSIYGQGQASLSRALAPVGYLR